MKKNDAIIVGASNSGFMAGLKLINKGYKVTLFDEHNNIGEFSKGVRKGRFFFDNNIHGMYMGESERNYRLDNLLEKVGIDKDVYLTQVDQFYTIICGEEKYTMPFGVDAFVQKMEEYVPGSKESVVKFFDLAEECCKAMEYIVDNIGNEISFDYFNEAYSNFVKISNASVSKVLDEIEMPLKAQEILNACWIYFGSSEVEISFIQYAMFMNDAIRSGLYVPVNGSYDITMLLAQSFLEKGGVIKLNSKVDKILVDDGKVNGIKLEDNTVYYSETVIVSSLENRVYTDLIEPSDLPREAIKSLNIRELGASLFTVHLGLNRSVEELGIDQYNYFVYDSMDTDILITKTGEAFNTNEVVTIVNNVNPDASDKGTSIMQLCSLISGDTFEEYIDENNYYEYLEDEANRMIDKFEKACKTKIKEYIEEICIMSPVHYSYLNSEYNGTVFGYKIRGSENLLPRILNYKNELYIDGLYLCGGFTGDVFGYDSDMMSGYIAALIAIKRMEG